MANKRNWRCEQAATLVFCAAVLAAAAAHGQTYTTVVNNGPSSNRVDMVFVGDGYQASEIDGTYAGHVSATLNRYFNTGLNPYPRYANFFNAHRVNVISNQSGADDPVNGIFVDTALDATYNTGGTDRCLYFNTTKANTAVNTALSGSGIDVDIRLGSVNSSKYGGCGGSWAVWSAQNGSALDIAVHEVGHSFGNLADEYWYSGTTWTGGEPGEVNSTSNPALGKWDRWLGYVDPDSSIGAIGYFEGARYNEFGLYRPSNNSMMRNLGRPFDAISRERFIQKIYAEVDPLDSWLSTTGTFLHDDVLWVDTVDPAVIGVEWFLNGSSLGLLGESLDLGTLGLSASQSYTVEAVAYDLILDHSNTGDSLDWFRLANTSSLRHSLTWTVGAGSSVPEPGTGFLTSVVLVSLLAKRRRREPGQG
ncbi:MAG: PEP-CTERM sorting domain-containing protein [Planctomycetales bacterium]|nr:PEP-CTERM sorting domain-containing protein [Planctomycetales bacterium]